MYIVLGFFIILFLIILGINFIYYERKNKSKQENIWTAFWHSILDLLFWI